MNTPSPPHPYTLGAALGLRSLDRVQLHNRSARERSRFVHRKRMLMISRATSNYSADHGLQAAPTRVRGRVRRFIYERQVLR